MLKYIFPLILVASQLKAANPAEANTIGSVARERSDLTTFLKILEKSDLASSLKKDMAELKKLGRIVKATPTIPRCETPLARRRTANLK